ncbi:anhydro-N-acetylmuramic acid kinase [Aureimonas psammosilenae]|uniref:anhydro-N-acetylmuramic acid kinase n=1 Tax=Aureimonas psammosilenae TaxID=2495496 RepID=UPI001260AC88|nr:anhydro-N-acetylmuramic acid kinase [Aureimonas psammosilenae]
MTTTEAVLAIGLMSGTSMDGIDVALIETDGERSVRRVGAESFAYDDAFRRRLAEGLEEAKAIAWREERPGSLALLERDLTDRHAEAVRAFAVSQGIDLARVDVVGFHGQTVLHRPADALTVQIGDGQRLANALDLAVVHDMRAADMAAGGQGAPLVPAYHAALVAALDEEFRTLPVAVVNIGGISNITYVDRASDPVAFDTGPGNALIDQWVSREASIPFDENGELAKEGRVLKSLAEHYLGSDFFAKPTPKSLDRFDFTVPAADTGTVEDVARTLCFVAAEAILKAVPLLPEPPKLWIVAGGGRRHPAIMADLLEGAKRTGGRVVSAEDVALDGDATEAEAWAYLAVRSRRGLPLSWPTTTGCRRPTPGGVLALPTSGASA